MTFTNHIEAVSSNDVVSDAPGLKVTSMEAMPIVCMVMRSPRLKQTSAKEKQTVIREKHSTMKENHKNLVPVRISPRKNLEVQQKQKKDK